jgi:protein-tyrosine phosphatase
MFNQLIEPYSRPLQYNFDRFGTMIDLHSHILPGVDDGAKDLALALDMARIYADQGVEVVACTPHILPGLYANSGPAITTSVSHLQAHIDDAGIPLRLTTGADNHVTPDFVAGLASGHLLPLAGSRYVLVEPPHHVAPTRLDELFFGILVAGYVPVLTHPERLTWIESKYDLITDLARRGVWMQITSGSLRGKFGSRPRYWAERMLDEGLVHILATDAHNLNRRPPDLHKGREVAEQRVGAEEATDLVVTRPNGILTNAAPEALPSPLANGRIGARDDDRQAAEPNMRSRAGVAGRLRRFFNS